MSPTDRRDGGRRRTRRGPGERAGISRAKILAAAADVVAADGLEGLTMRRLAGRLGVAPNTLYSHFTDKTELLDALIDRLLADIDGPDPATGDWRAGLMALMTASRQLLLAHADLIPLVLSRPARGPSALRLGEGALALLERGGVRGHDAVAALRILLVYTFGFVAQEAPRRADPEPARRRAASEAAMRGAPGLPRVHELAPALAEHPGDATFATGLSWLLAGIAAGPDP